MLSNARLRFDPRSDTPAVRQISDGIRVLLVEGQLRPGASLPSVRRLAVELGVHFNTVAEAYRDLAAEGWLDLRHGRGAVVVARPVPTVPDDRWHEEFRGQIRSLVAQMRSRGISTERLAAELRAMAEVVTHT